MIRENVKEYITFLREANRPLYTHEMFEVMEELLRLEKKLTLKQITDIKYMSDTDLCRRYNLEPKDINSKYVDCVIDGEERKVEERLGNIIVSTTYNVVRGYEKTDFAKIRNDIVKQVMSNGNQLRRLDNDRFMEIMDNFN